MGSHSSSSSSQEGEHHKDGRWKPQPGTESLGEVESCRAGDWKDELKDIQAARVEQEVARLQRTIEETQRRWETYARHAPGRGTTVLSDGSVEQLHHPRPEAYLVPPRHDLWRTVSEDTISVPLKEAPSEQPLLRHISMDNIRPAAKVSNIHPLAHHPHQSTTSMNSVSSSLDGPPPAHLGRSVESVGGYSDRDALDSDGSLQTPEESLTLPSVRRLASKFDSAPQKVNNLDKHGKSNSLTYSGKNIQSGGRTSQGDRAAFTNNLNKGTEKPYTMKEVRSVAEVQAPSDSDSHSSDDDHSVFDDAATVTSMSLPPTPVSLSNQHSYSTSSLIDTDSSSHFDSRDPDSSGPRTFFGVTLRSTKRSTPIHVYSKKRDSASDEASQADPRDLAGRRLSSRSTASLGRATTPSSSEEDTPTTLRQSTIISVDAQTRISYSNTWSSASLKSSGRSQSLANINSQLDQSSGNPPTSKPQNLGTSVGYAFAPKGKRTMDSFLRAYSRQKSLHNIHQIDEKSEENFSNKKTDDDQHQQSLQTHWTQSASLPATLKKAKSEKSLRAIDQESVTVKANILINTKTQPPVHHSTTVNGHTSDSELPKSISKTSAPEVSVEPSVADTTVVSKGSLSDKETPPLKESVPKEVNDSSDEDGDSSHSSSDDEAPVAATMVYCTGKESSEVVLNKAHISAFQEHLKKETSSSAPKDDTQVSETTGGATLRRHKSVGDLLKEYTNIKSLDSKKNVLSNAAFPKVDTTQNTEPYKTVIEVQHSSTQGSSTGPSSSHTKTQSLKKANPKPSPPPKEKSVTQSYHKHMDQKAVTNTVPNTAEKKSPDDYDGTVFHASTIYVGDDGSDSPPDYSARITVNGRTSPTVKTEVTVNQCYVSVPPESQKALPAGNLDATTTEKSKKGKPNKSDPVTMTDEVNRTVVNVRDEKASSSSHVRVIRVTEKDNVDKSSSSSSSEEEDIEKINPKVIKERIMKESRTGKSGSADTKDLVRKQKKIMDATVPLHSPFSPLRPQLRKKSSSSLSPSEEAAPKLPRQDSQDEGVDFPSDTPPSASSQDPAGHEGGQPRV